MENSKVVGIKKMTNSETKKESFMYYFTTPFSGYDIEHTDCIGVSVTAEYSSIDLGLKVGDVGQLIYSKGFQDKAVLTGFVPLLSK